MVQNEVGTTNPKLVPELDVSDLRTSVAFYVRVCGFSIVYERPEERFAYVEKDGAELMLQEADGPGRRFRTAPLEKPYGRGINLQIEARDVDELHERAVRAGHRPVIALEERWYRRNDAAMGHRQFVLPDPDGYLLRFFRTLGRRPV